MLEKRMIRIQQIAREDGQYRQMMDEHTLLRDRMNEVMNQLPGEQRGVVEDYLGLIAMMGNRMLIIACENMELKEKAKF